MKNSCGGLCSVLGREILKLVFVCIAISNELMSIVFSGDFYMRNLHFVYTQTTIESKIQMIRFKFTGYI